MTPSIPWRVFLMLLFTAGSAATVQAQRVAPSRFMHSRAIVPSLNTFSIGAPEAARVPLAAVPAAAPFGRQVLAGVGGWLVGFVAGGLIAARSSDDSDGFVASTAVAVTALAGGALGSAVGVQWYGKRHGVRSPFIATLAGSALGTLPVIVSPISAPVGATLLYNHFRRERSAP